MTIAQTSLQTLGVCLQEVSLCHQKVAGAVPGSGIKMPCNAASLQGFQGAGQDLLCHVSSLLGRAPQRLAQRLADSIGIPQHPAGDLQACTAVGVLANCVYWASVKNCKQWEQTLLTSQMLQQVLSFLPQCTWKFAWRHVRNSVLS